MPSRPESHTSSTTQAALNLAPFGSGFLLLIAALAVLLVSCSTPPQRPASPPIFGIHYYPYTVSGVRTTAAPTPNYKEWSGERMRRDLERLEKTGVDVVIVSVNPEEIARQGKGAAYLRFIELAGKMPNCPKVMFMAESHGAVKSDVKAFLDWCVAQKFEGKKGYFLFEGKPLVELYDAPDDKTARPAELTLRHTVWAQKWHCRLTVPREVLRQEWYWSVAKTPEATVLSKNGEQAMVFAGFLKNGDKGPVAGWDVDRADGRALRDRIRAAVALKPKIICVVSWNDFWEGHFIEPNNFDGNKLSRVLAGEIAAVKAAR